MPLPVGFGVASGTGSGTCALTQTTLINTRIRIALNRQMLGDIDWTFQQGTFGPDEIVNIRVAVNFFAGDIDLKTFQQGTFGPGEIVKISVADETPAAKN